MTAENSTILAKNFLPQDPDARKILELRAKLLANTIQKATELELNEISYIKFSLDVEKEYYGIPFKFVKELLPNAQITKIPRAAPNIFGVMNYRGALIAVIDFKKFFSNNHFDYNQNSSIIVIHVNNITIGMLIGHIIGNDQYPLGSLEPPFNFPGISNPDLIAGLHEGATAIINIELLAETLIQLKS